MECEFKKSLLSHTGGDFCAAVHKKSKPTGQITNKVKNSQQEQMSPACLALSSCGLMEAGRTRRREWTARGQPAPTGLPFKDLTL